jgi:hypothetical protein
MDRDVDCIIARCDQVLGETALRQHKLPFLFGDENELVQCHLGDGSLQAVVLAFEILQALGLIELQTAVVAPPAVVALLRDVEAPADGTDRLPLTEADLHREEAQ